MQQETELLPCREEGCAEKQNLFLSARNALACLCSDLAQAGSLPATLNHANMGLAPTSKPPENLLWLYAFAYINIFQFLLNKELKFNPGLPNQTSNLRRASPSFLLPSVSWEVFWVLTSTVAPNKKEVNFVQAAEVQRLSSMQVFCEAEQQEVRNSEPSSSWGSSLTTTRRAVHRELERKQRDLSQITDENRLLIRLLIQNLRVLWTLRKRTWRKCCGEHLTVVWFEGKCKCSRLRRS